MWEASDRRTKSASSARLAQKVFQDAFAVNGLLCDDSSDGKHSKAAVVEFLSLNGG